MTTPNDLTKRECFRRRRSLVEPDSLLFLLAAAGVWLLLLGFVWLGILVIRGI